MVLIALGPFLPQRSRHVAGGFVFAGQELVKLGGDLRRDDDGPPVAEGVLVIGHPEDRVGLGVAATTWRTDGVRTGGERRESKSSRKDG